jgi:outer membrane protein
MKKSILFFMMLLGFSMTVCAQKIVLIDTEYILKNIPAYNNATTQIEQSSKKWQGEIEASSNEAKTMYSNYQKMSKLTNSQKTLKENAIVAKEKEVLSI